MLSETAKSLDRFFRSFTSTCRPLLLLDYDGTLAPFRVNRFTAKPWAGARELLNQIQANGRTRMVVVTGRPASEIQPLLALNHPLEVWGLHGFERLYSDGRRELEEVPEKVREKLDQLHAALRRDAFGGLLEEKPNAAVMHWRGLAANKAAEVKRRTIELFEPVANHDGFRLLPFEAGIELRVGRDKGEAVTAILNECDVCGPVSFLGDDLTDEAAFCAVRSRGLGVLVRTAHRRTNAHLWLKPPEELIDFLEMWLQSVMKPAPSSTL